MRFVFNIIHFRQRRYKIVQSRSIEQKKRQLRERLYRAI